MGKIRAWLTYWLQLPPEPEAPYGEEGATRLFKPSRRYFQLRLARWALVQFATAFGIFAALNWRAIPNAAEIAERIHFGPFELADFLGSWFFHSIEIWGVGVFLLQIPITLASVQLDYEMRWYLVTDRSLRIREGLKTVRERTMTFANVQNLTIRQNPLQRFFGISDLRVRSAGGGSSTDEYGSNEQESADKTLHLAVFRGIENAGEIRELILAHLKQLKTSGIGDPDDIAATTAPSAMPNQELTQIAEDLRAETARLRASIAALR